MCNINGGFVFAIDCDEVLRPTLDNMLKVYNDAFPYDIKLRDEVKDFRVDKSFPKIQEVFGIDAGEWFFQIHSVEIFEDSKPYETTAEDIKLLQKYGRVVIVTHQKGYLNKRQTLDWLYINGIEPDGVCFLKDKTMIKADIFIDDNDWNFIGCNCKCGVLIDAPYNKDTNINELKEKSNCEQIYRAKSLHEFVQNFVQERERIYN